MPCALDLNAYFHRIGYNGSRTPSLETLAAIHLRHALTIPFENLDPLMRRPVGLDTASLQQKLVHDKRGGYCFEQNLLLSAVLQQLGFDVTCLAARVVWNVTSDAIRPRSHMLLLVKLGGTPYVADVGFGGITLTAPLRLEAEIEQPTPHEPFRLHRTGDAFELQACLSARWKPLYRFDLQPQFLADYEVSNWYLCHHPSSQFVNGLMVARPDRDRRYALLNNQFTIHHLHGQSERRALSSVTEMRATLADAFRIALPDTPELDAALERLLPAPASART